MVGKPFFWRTIGENIKLNHCCDCSSCKCSSAPVICEEDTVMVDILDVVDAVNTDSLHDPKRYRHFKMLCKLHRFIYASENPERDIS